MIKSKGGNMAESSDKALVVTTLYRLNRDNQEKYISQQWKAIYYAVLLYGGIFAAFNHWCPLEKTIAFPLVATIVFVISSILLVLLQCSINEANNFNNKFRNNELIFKEEGKK